MPTFRLRHFAAPEALKAMAPSRLIALLSGFSDYLSAREFTLPANGADIDYESLNRILMTPDDSVPPSMVDALYFVDEMAHPEGMDRILDEAALREIDLQLEENPTPADVAVAAWLALQLRF